MNNFQRGDSLAKHVCSVIYPGLKHFCVFHPLFDVAASMRHQNLTVVLAHLVAKHHWETGQFAAWIDHRNQFGARVLLAETLKQRKYLDLGHD